jgi:hypothetical protein
MKLQFVSDLHIEFREKNIVRNSYDNNDKYNVDRDATNIHLLYRLKGNNSNDIY